MNAPKPKRRGRVASDSAHAWARCLKLGNPYAKLVLVSCCLYVNDAGSCFVGIATLADDTELSADTVRKRLKWLEDIGAIVRFPRWIDENGRANSDGRGKRTSDEIRLMIDEEPEAIEARANGQSEPVCEDDAMTEAAEVSPLNQQGLNQSPENAQDSASPRPALGQPSDSGKGLDSSEPEPEVSPPTPLAGGCDVGLSVLAEAYPIPITDVPKASAVWSALSEQERSEALLGARGYRDFIEKERKRGRNRNVKDCHRWLRDRGWIGYLEQGKKADAIAQRCDIAEGSEEWKAWDVFERICGSSNGILRRYCRGEPGSRTVNVPMAFPPVGAGIDKPYDQWETVVEGSGQFAAWLRKLTELPDVRVSARPVLHEGRMRPSLRVPAPWPPNKSDLAKTG